MDNPVMSRVAGLALIALAASTAYAANEVPGWVTEAAASTVPRYASKVGSVILFQEEAVTVDPDGRQVMRERRVVKILQPNGEKLRVRRTYNTKNGRIRDFQGWLLPPTGKPVFYAKNNIVDVALSLSEVYDEGRAKVLDCGTAAVGSVFAWEVTEEEKTNFTQYGYEFQERSPVLLSRFSLTLPAAWEMKGEVFNRDRVEPKVSANTYTWELRDLPWIEPEDYSPSLSSLAPRVTVSYFPPPGNSAGLQGLKDWAAVSSWLAPMVDPQAEPTDTIRAKAAQLTASATSELDKIRAIAAFAQQTNYVAISLNLTRGGGYTPHRSQDILARNYGDCKDKVTLMRALLKAVGIDSYLTTIDAEDRTFVRPEWASPMQFNHAIAAVRVSSAVSLPSVIENAALGRLLMFDPTDPITPVGDLPEDEQGAYALIIAGAKGALLKMPLLPATSHRIESTVMGSLDAAGRLDARIGRQYFGQSGMAIRAVEKFEGAPELKKRFERNLSRRIAGMTLSRVATDGKANDNSLAVDVELAADRFAQIMQGRLFIVRPGLLTSGGEYFFSPAQRSAPIKLESDLRRDSVKIKIPAGFRLDELPAPSAIESAYGTFRATWAVENGEITLEETLEIRDTMAPASEYAKVREFFELIAGAHGAPVVLVKQ